MKRIISIFLVIALFFLMLPHISVGVYASTSSTIEALNSLLIGAEYSYTEHTTDVAKWSDETVCDMIWGKLLWDSFQYSDYSYLHKADIAFWNGNDGYLHFNLEAIRKITQDTLGRDFPSNTQSEYIFVSGDELLIVEAIGESRTLTIQEYVQNGSEIIAVGTAVHNNNADSEYLGYFQAVFEENPSSIYGYTLISLSRIDGNQSFSNLSASASSELKEASITHDAKRVLDGDLGTAWVEGVAGLGVNEWIKLETTDGSKINVSAIEFSMGYQKNNQTMRKNGWPCKVLIECEGGYQQEAEFYNYSDIVVLNQSVTTSWIRITILEAAQGAQYEDTCISEISLKGINTLQYFGNLNYPTENNSIVIDGEALKDKYGVSSQEQFVSCLGTDIQLYPTGIYGIVSMVTVDLNDDSIDELVVLRVAEKDNKDEAQIIAEVYQGTNGYTLSDSKSVYSVSFCAAANLYLFYSDVLGEYCLMIESYSSGSYTGVSSWEAKVFTITAESIESYAYWEAVPFAGIYADFEEELKAINAPYAKYCTEYENVDNGLYYQPLCEIEHETYGDTSSYISRNHKLTIKSISGIQANAVEDYARTEWIKQHMEYSSSDEYEDEIVGGYNDRMMAVFRDALDDEDIKSYETRKTISAMLNLDVELSEADMYELIIAEILYGERGQHITEETYNQNLRNSVANVAKVLVNMATSGDTAKEIPSDVLDSIEESYELLQTLEFGSEEYGNTYSKFISLLKGNVKDLKSKLKTELAGDAAFTGLGIVIDGAFEQYEALEDILSYINNYVAYQSTSKQLHDVLGHLLVVIYMHQGNKGLDGADEFIDELGLWAAMTNWADFQTAVISVMEAMAAYEKEGAAAIAEYAVEREREAGQKFGAKALKSVTVFVVEKAASCVPVINTILLVKNVANVVVSATVILDQIFTNVDEREYALDMLTKSYCISVMLDQTVDNCVDCMSEDDFYSTTVFDESVSLYKRNLLLASGYAVKYTDMVLENARQELAEYDQKWHLFDGRDKLVRVVEWYSNSLKILEEQQIEIEAIACHDSNLYYDQLKDEIIYNFRDSRIYIVACPVDVVVRNEAGDQIAYLSGEDNQVQEGYEFYFHTIKATDDSGEYIKVAIVPDGYHIELKGTDDGTMHAFVADFTEGDVGKVETYFNIPIEKDSEGYFEASTDDTNTSSLVMEQVEYSNMESVEDIPTDSESNDAWIWIAGSIIVCGIILIIILKKKSHK